MRRFSVPFENAIEAFNRTVSGQEKRKTGAQRS